MIKVMDIMEKNPPEKPLTAVEYKRHVKRTLDKLNIPAVKATYMEDGNCAFCGEAGRCPGWHSAEEVKALDPSGKEILDALKALKYALDMEGGIHGRIRPAHERATIIMARLEATI